MVEKLVTSPAKVIELARFRHGRADKVLAVSVSSCRHCGGMLLAGENEDECSSTFNAGAAARSAGPRRFYAE